MLILMMAHDDAVFLTGKLRKTGDSYGIPAASMASYDDGGIGGRSARRWRRQWRQRPSPRGQASTVSAAHRWRCWCLDLRLPKPPMWSTFPKHIWRVFYVFFDFSKKFRRLLGEVVRPAWPGRLLGVATTTTTIIQLTPNSELRNPNSNFVVVVIWYCLHCCWRLLDLGRPTSSTATRP